MHRSASIAPVSAGRGSAAPRSSSQNARGAASANDARSAAVGRRGRPRVGRHRRLTVRGAGRSPRCPTTTITARSASAGSRRPYRAAEHAADRRADRDARDRLPRHVGDEDEHDAGDEVHQAGEHVLQRVDPLELLAQRQAQDAEQQDPLGRAEVAAVDAGRRTRRAT